MKIFDSSSMIAIFNEIKYPGLIDRILELGHDLAIPSHTFHVEMLDSKSMDGVRRCVDDDKIRILEMNSMEDIDKFRSSATGLGIGESDVLLTYQRTKDAAGSVYCIIDDRAARNVALRLNIAHTGLFGLLLMLEKRSIIPHGDVRKVLEMLGTSGFWLPPDAGV